MLSEFDPLRRSSMLARHTCQSVDRGGTPKACLVGLKAPALEMPSIRQECGPFCAGENGARYAVDEHGYCVRCLWAYPAKSTSANDHGELLSSTCSFGRRGSRFVLRASGAVHADVDAGWTPWVWVKLDGKSGANVSSCSNTSPGGDCWLKIDNMGPNLAVPSHPAGLDVRGELFNGGPDLKMWLHQSMCQANGDRGCRYASIVMEACDADATDCATPFQLAGTIPSQP